ncbi:alpha/beta hydrolase [Flagellimonas sp. CMM7]|uniref:alpha/beta hydrolase n=1 Tax=Flagellimonas sp. CMM7 TaxID=2654676 RepID=UPI0013D8DB70|nr:alpha/beta hydrolase-fold protein [Flagellimonas sp. CMM7]UII81420.1 hypothetical protein LV704_07845 [Flagellimonas sp. CMM7]
MKILRNLFLLFCTFIHWQCLNAQKESDQNYTLLSEHLGENRIIQIHVPKSYNNTDRAYPVLFVLDGEYIFDYAKGIASFLSNDFGFHPEMIVIGIPNTDRNRDLFVDLKPEGAYHNFVSFIEEELLPYISKNYRTNTFKILYGWSSGSSLANYIFVKNPSLFRGYILSGVGIGPKTEAFIKKELKSNAYERIRFFASTEGNSFRTSALKKMSNLSK